MRRLDRSTVPPYSLVTSRQLFPIQSSLALAATVLWGRGVRMRGFYHKVSDYYGRITPSCLQELIGMLDELKNLEITLGTVVAPAIFGCLIRICPLCDFFAVKKEPRQKRDRAPQTAILW